MKIELSLLMALAFGLTSNLSWAQSDLELVISPGLPSSEEPITILVPNSRCYSNAEVIPPTSPEDQTITIRLTYLTGPYGECLQNNPDAPDFESTIGPLATGDYAVGLFIHRGGRSGSLTDTAVFSVINAPIPANLSEGGINGLYHDQQAPHRYLYVLETDYTTLVVWNTFDPEGNQLWVYGVGDLLNDGSSVVAETYINTSGGFLPNGEADDDVEPWGFIRVDLASCLEGTVTYHSDLPEFGSGQFSIVRLANAKQIGCVDSE